MNEGYLTGCAIEIYPLCRFELFNIVWDICYMCTRLSWIRMHFVIEAIGYRAIEYQAKYRKWHWIGAFSHINLIEADKI